LIYPKLSKLFLSNNLINSIEEIKVLSKLENLLVIDLFECPINKVKDYKKEIFKALPKLQVLDGKYKDGTEYEYESEDYCNK
jgi:Leucine-rich repeat (LRR) protein